MYSSICKVLGWIVLISGLIGTVIFALVYGKTYDYYEYERNWTLTVVYLSAGGFATAIQSIVLLSLGKILEVVQGLEDSVSKIEKNSTLKAASDRVPSDNEWKCQGCGRINSILTGTCACGKEKQC